MDDYFEGPRHFWTHFWCGFVFGGAIGAWVGVKVFDSIWLVAVAAILSAVIAGSSCGRWGDRTWRWIMEALWWLP
jgi:hypothetical protein